MRNTRAVALCIALSSQAAGCADPLAGGVLKSSRARESLEAGVYFAALPLRWTADSGPVLALAWGDVTTWGKPFGCEHKICRSSVLYKKLRTEPELSLCAVTVVSETLVLTAEHCVERHGSNGCRNASLKGCKISLVSGYTQADASPFAPISSQSVLSAELVAKNDANDWALLRLNRPFAGQPVSLSFGEVVGSMTLRQFPRGAPLMEGGFVRCPGAGDQVWGIASAFNRSSGSPLLNADREMVGLMVKSNGGSDDRYRSGCIRESWCTASTCADAETLGCPKVRITTSATIRGDLCSGDAVCVNGGCSSAEALFGCGS